LSLMIAEALENGNTGYGPGAQNLSETKDIQIPLSSIKTDASESIKDQKSAASSGADQTGPKIVSHLGDLDYMVGAFPPDNRPLIWAEYSDDNSGVDTNSIKMFIDEQEITSLCDITPEKISFKPAQTLDAPQLYKFTVIVSDKAGNKAELVWEILLKRC